MTEPPFEPGTVLGRRYRIESVLGTGGMGRVYRACDEALGRPVALKVLHAGMGAMAARFEREARAGASLSHPAVVRVLAYGLLDDARPYLALELVEGQSLSERLRSGGPVAAAEAVAWLRPVAGALAEAHRGGVVHRDLKPENLLLSYAPGLAATLRLLDFGIAGLIAPDDDEAPPMERLTLTGQVFGTPEYMSPEQAMGQRTTPATDVWAFGCVLQACLTGKSPFSGAHIPEILYRVLNTPADPLPPGVPEGVVALIADCLNKAPEARPADGAALLLRMEALSALEVRAPTLPVSPTPTLREPGPIRAGRSPWLAAVVGAVAGSAATLLVVSLVSGAGGAVGATDDSPIGASLTSAAAPAPTSEAREASVVPPVSPSKARAAEVLAELREGRLGAAVPALRSLLIEAPELASDAALVAAVMVAFETRDGAALAEFVAGAMLAACRERLLELSGSPDSRLRWRAVRSFPAETPDGRAARVQALRQDLRIDDCQARKRTIVELGRLGDVSAAPDIRAVRQRYNFLQNLCLGNTDAAALRKLKR